MLHYYIYCILHIHINQNLLLLYGNYLKFLPHLLHCKQSIVVHQRQCGFCMANLWNQELQIIRELLCQKKHKFMQIWPELYNKHKEKLWCRYQDFIWTSSMQCIFNKCWKGMKVFFSFSNENFYSWQHLP